MFEFYYFFCYPSPNKENALKGIIILNTFNFRKADNRYKELFFQFPKVLYYSQKYKKNLSLSAKAAYMVLMDREDRKSTRLNSSHVSISYAVFCLKKKKKEKIEATRPIKLSNQNRTT